MRGLRITPATVIAGMVVIMVLFLFKEELIGFISYFMDILYDELFRDSVEGLKTLHYNVFKG